MAPVRDFDIVEALHEADSDEPKIDFSAKSDLAGRCMHSVASFSGQVEFNSSFAPRSQTTHVLFDFDGTLSLIREGWPEVMLPMFVEMLPAQVGETDEARRSLLYEDIMRLNGKQTIYQMIQLAERVKERGGQPREPLWYKREYLRRLQERIRRRVDGIRDGSLRRDDFLVHGTRPFLEN